MSTPKELADKAKQQIEACKDAWTATERTNAESALHVTIDQLQAMAETRQGSGEPVAWLREQRDGFEGQQTLDPLLSLVAEVVEARHMNQEHLARLRAFVEPSAQQATGSGQVLTDGFSYTASKQLVTVTKEWCRGWDACRAALAAATQAQPESREQRLATAMKRFDEHGPLPGMISAFEQQFGQTWTDREWRQEASIWSAAWRAALAAPTTGKREPLSDEQRTELARSFTGRNVPAIASPELWFQRGISAAERAHGITGEQR